MTTLKDPSSCLALTDESPMPFGKYKGEKLGEVPSSYLLWFFEQKWASDWPELYDYVEEHYETLEEDAVYEQELRNDVYMDDPTWDR